MYLDVWLRTLLDQENDASRLITRKILVDNAATRQDQRILFVGHFVWRTIFKRMKLRLTVGVIKPFLKEARRARVIFARARPEDAVIALNLFPGDAVVIAVAAARRDTQFIEDRARRFKLEIFLTAQAARDLQIGRAHVCTPV